LIRVGTGRKSWRLDTCEVLGELHFPLYLGGSWGDFWWSPINRDRKGELLEKTFSAKLPQYGCWIGDRGAIGDALILYNLALVT
jgi:hypothetical protein